MGDLVARAARLAGEKLAEVLPRRWAHVQGAGRGARVAAPLLSVDDGELLIGAALLHDIGYAPDVASTGFHALDGARYLRRAGSPDRLVNLVAHHSCATLEGKLRGLSDELAEFEDERTPLRDALWWVDMTTTPDAGRETRSRAAMGRMTSLRASFDGRGEISTQRQSVRSVGSKRLASLRHRMARRGARIRVESVT